MGILRSEQCSSTLVGCCCSAAAQCSVFSSRGAESQGNAQGMGQNQYRVTSTLVRSSSDKAPLSPKPVHPRVGFLRLSTNYQAP